MPGSIRYQCPRIMQMTTDPRASADRKKSSVKTSLPRDCGIAGLCKPEARSTSETAPEKHAPIRRIRLTRRFRYGRLKRYRATSVPHPHNHGFAPSICAFQYSAFSWERRVFSAEPYTSSATARSTRLIAALKRKNRSPKSLCEIGSRLISMPSARWTATRKKITIPNMKFG